MCPVPLSPFTAISKSCVWETHCGTTDRRDSLCLTRALLLLFHLSRLFHSGPPCFVLSPLHEVIWFLHLFFSFSVSSPHFHFLHFLPFFQNHFYFLIPLTWWLPPLISLPVSSPHVYLAPSFSLVVSSLGKLKRCEERNKSKSKNAFRGWRQAQTSVCLSEDS